MKKNAVAVCLAGMLFSSSVYGQMQVALIQDADNYSDWIGGEFRAETGGTPNLSTAVNQSAYAAVTSGTIGTQYYFQTFCIEFTEDFTPGATYNVSISPNAMFGDQPPLGDPVSIGTAWLYSQFAAGTLVGLTAGNVATPYDYTYGNGRVTTAGELQTTIWWLEAEPDGIGDPGSDNVFRNVVLAHFGSATNAMADAHGAYGVEALNLGEPGQVQDQLVIVPEPTIAALTVIGSTSLLIARCRTFFGGKAVS